MVAHKKRSGGGIAIVSGARTPMVKMGGALKPMHVTDLARVVMQEALYRVDFPAQRVHEVVLGNVVMPADAANPARVAAMRAGLPRHVPALTVQRNCASGMEAVAEAMMRIRTGSAQVVLAGGAESMSNIPLLFPDEALDPMARLARARSLTQKVGAIFSLRPRHFAPRSGLVLGLTDPLCNMIMGKTAEVLAHEFGLSRREQDTFAMKSHHKAVAAAEGGRFADQIVPVYAGKRCEPIAEDIGPRPGQTLEALGKLRPLFDRKDGTVTVGNACQVTDGAAALLVVDAELARSEGLEVLATIRGYAAAGLDPHRMGLGPVFAMDKLLQEQGLALSDIGLFEINEAFAAQVLACLKAMGSDAFAQKELGRSSAVGELDPEKLNVNGGAVALGHPVGATGARMVLNLVTEMKQRDVQFAVASLCVAGGQGAAILLERS